MNPVNATALYISASRLVLNYDPGDPKAFTEINRLLPYFRQSLSCCVCGHLLQDPIAPTNSTCQHYVCKTCKGKKMMMKPSCSWCKDYEQFEENKQLSILVNCYKKLCEYITQTTLARDIIEAVDGSSDILALLNDGSLLCEETEKPSDSSFTLPLTHSPLPSTSEPTTDPQASLSPISESTLSIAIGSSVINGLPIYNGLSIDRFGINIPSPEHSNTIDVCNTVDIKTEDLSDSLPPVCDTVATDLCSTGIDICSFSEDIKPGDSLLLSVEEVLRSLETVSNTEVCCPNLQPNLEVSNVSNGPFLQLSSQSLSHNVFMSTSPALHGLSCTAATPKVAKLNRKRSRSESDSEKVQPLPISTIIRGPTLGASVPVTVKRESKISLQPIATVPNGGTTPKISKTVLLSTKSMKKSHDHGSKKSHSKTKPGILKKDKTVKEKIPSHHFMPGSPTKTVCKKTQEKKGCKCGRATQNPSVLTCRGQRCPCYSNRKACLDCICRGCQNSYMANGEKKLEAFAVPEKALEQTRLTLGINVTSIAVRNASTSTSVINVTGSPVTTFLAASTHDDKSLDEAIDMRFDC
ncbi:E3 ubiquitin-protein ligase MSL2 [Myotis yumanensis]|uniref:E3 ubiquitin-protein ligase MSL2 n=3 Tax=Myotis TaxID=9434 RepID=G1P6D9_MYOLU|nr:PREDICTED: E3 ubiquitin-protein ligase MSL2 [Myotis brandtii]XP_006083788.1 E3 ubiquitin-protein ligase MSL2 [Myotis lucifugus]XP_006759871.1 PREDICTED: E3 ubiquitin-protein ligase MSL2 [Myotis davidii]XP_059519856.1 E3 ubiquitin-protein ligase MSL2 isoform X1 [Myotis daubentonii]EPQ06091.1 Male-specific lethal 2 like protein [Myotis brandtii]